MPKKKGEKNLTLKLEKSKSLKLTETPRRQKVFKILQKSEKSKNLKKIIIEL